MTPSTEAVTASLPREKQGAASALNDVTGEFGTALGVALLGAPVSAGYRTSIDDRLPAPRTPHSRKQVESRWWVYGHVHRLGPARRHRESVGGLVDQATRGALADGRYVLVRPVASGGMGRIWEARDTRLDRTVAIKEVSLDLIPPIQRTEFIERAVNEGRHAAALADHPNIVTVHDVVVEDGAPWTVMQFVRGRSLAGVLESGPLSVAATATLARQMLSALALAHGTGIVHRDVKPPNIMVADRDGTALLTDFGIAKGSGDVSLTRSGVVVGSSAYMAPERHEGHADGPAADLFSLGVTLFEAVEGYSPFARESRTGTVTAILVKPLPPMPRAGRLEPLIRALTEKEPARRPSAEQALAMLEVPGGEVPPPRVGGGDDGARDEPPVTEAGSAAGFLGTNDPVGGAGSPVTETAPTRSDTVSAPAAPATADGRFPRTPSRHWSSVLWATAIFVVATFLPIASEYRYLKQEGVRNASETLSFDYSAPWRGRVTAGTDWDTGFQVAVGVLIVGTAAVLLIAAIWPLLAAREVPGAKGLRVFLGTAAAAYTLLIAVVLTWVITASLAGSEQDTKIAGDIDRIMPWPGAWLLVAALVVAVVAIVRAARLKRSSLNSHLAS